MTIRDAGLWVISFLAAFMVMGWVASMVPDDKKPAKKDNLLLYVIVMGGLTLGTRVLGRCR